MSNVIYVDVLLLINLIVNFLMLSATDIFTGKRSRSWRILLSSIMGAIYSLVVLIPDMSVFLSVVLRIACFLIMLFTAFGIHTLKDFLRAAGGFFMANFAFAGIMLAVWFVFKPNGMIYQNGAVYFDISAITLILSAGAGYLIIRIISRLTKKNAPDSHTAILSVALNEKDIECTALIDTGSALKEPFSSYPAIICEFSFIESVLSEDMKKIVCGGFDNDTEYKNVAIRFISFKSVGGSGVLPAILAQKVTVAFSGKIYENKKVYIAVYNGTLSGDEYRALVGNNFFEGAQRGEGKGAKFYNINKAAADKTDKEKQRRNTLHKRLRDTSAAFEKR